MSRIRDQKAEKRNFHIESYDSAIEVVENCKSRQRTDMEFHDAPSYVKKDGWCGVSSYEEALELMKTGYQPTVDKLREAFKINRTGVGTRFLFKNEIQGFAPIVPLALKNVPNCMVDMRMTPIKSKVVDVYYDMTASCSVRSDDIIKAGQKLLGAVVELERQGYRFNLYAVQTYSDDRTCDMLTVRVKRDSQPLDLKRVSFPLAHTGFFRAIGFDWYSKVPGGKYRCGYGHGIAYDFNERQLDNIAKTLFGKNAIYLSAAKIINENEKHIKEVLTDAECKN